MRQSLRKDVKESCGAKPYLYCKAVVDNLHCKCSQLCSQNSVRIVNYNVLSIAFVRGINVRITVTFYFIAIPLGLFIKNNLIFLKPP